MKLQRYILRQLAVAFVFAAGGILFVALPGIAVGAVHKLAGVGTMPVLKYLPLVVAGFVPYVLPVAFLLALVATYGRLAADNEWTAIRMAGVNPYRMLGPALILGALISGGIYFMNSEALPWIRYQQKAFRAAALRDVIKHLSPGRTELALGEFFLTAQDRDERDRATFLRVFIKAPHPYEPGRTVGLFAERARFSFTDVHMIVELHNLQGTLVGDRGRGGGLTLAWPLQDLLKEPTTDYSSARYKSSGELLSASTDSDLTPREQRQHVYAFHERMANAVTCIMFVFLGVPTGILMRRGTQLAALAVAVGYAILYWLFSLRLGEELGEAGAIPPAVAAWGSLGLWMLGAALLTRKAFAQ